MSCTKLFRQGFTFGKIKDVSEKTNYNLILQYKIKGIPYDKCDIKTWITRIYPFHHKETCTEVINQIKEKKYCFKCSDPTKCDEGL